MGDPAQGLAPLEWTVGQPGFSNVIWLLQLVFGPCTLGTMWWLRAPAPVSQIWMTLWGWTRVGLVSAQYARATTKDGKELARDLTLNIPALGLRFLSLPSVNEPAYFIPVLALIVLIGAGFGASIGITLAQILPPAGAPARLPAAAPVPSPAPA